MKIRLAVLSFVVLLNLLGIAAYITEKKSLYIMADKYGLTAYSKLGVVEITKRYEEELRRWPLLWLDPEFRSLIIQLRKTSAIAQKSKKKGTVNVISLTPTPTPPHPTP